MDCYCQPPPAQRVAHAGKLNSSNAASKLLRLAGLHALALNPLVVGSPIENPMDELMCTSNALNGYPEQRKPKTTSKHPRTTEYLSPHLADKREAKCL